MSNARSLFREFLERHGLPSTHIYLLNLVPLIDMVWADGSNQRGEMVILEHYVRDLRQRLREMADGLEVISDGDYERFKAFFLAQRPDAAVLRELHEIAREQALSTPISNPIEWEVIVDYCMDIAAACVTEYPYDFNERITFDEKQLLKTLVIRLRGT